MRRIILFANGEVTPTALQISGNRLRANDILIAVDGGITHCLALGLLPHELIGDMDSVPPTLREQLSANEVSIITHPPQKNETDLELALLHSIQKHSAQKATNYDDAIQGIVIVGGMGGRVDMALSNVQLLLHPKIKQQIQAGLHIEFWQGSQTAWLLLPPGGNVVGQAGDTVSLIPMEGKAMGIQTHGLQYPLHEEDLSLGYTRGISNVMMDTPAQIKLRQGSLLVVHTSGTQSH